MMEDQFLLPQPKLGYKEYRRQIMMDEQPEIHIGYGASDGIRSIYERIMRVEQRMQEEERRMMEDQFLLPQPNFVLGENLLRSCACKSCHIEQDRLENDSGREMTEAMCALEAQPKNMSFYLRCRNSYSGKWDSMMVGEEVISLIKWDSMMVGEERATAMEKMDELCLKKPLKTRSLPEKFQEPEGRQRFNNMDHILVYPKISEQIESTGRDGFDGNFSLRYVLSIPGFRRDVFEGDVQMHTLPKIKLRTPYVISRWNGNKKSLIKWDSSIAVDIFWSGTLDTSEPLRYIVNLSIQEGNPFEYKYFGRNPMGTENEENGQTPKIRNAVINDKAGPTELEMFTAESYRQSEQLRRENDKQILEIEEALRRILHHLDVQPKVEKRRRCLASA